MRPDRGISRLLKSALVAATALTLVGATLAAMPAVAAVSAGIINSNGPLTRIQTTADLTCAVNHSGDTLPEFFGTTACATLVALDGTLYGPADIPAGGSASPRTTWVAESQTSSGSGTTLDPFRIVTVVKGGVLVVTQTDTYVEGSEAYGTRVSIENTAASAKTVTLYRAGDCFLQNSDVGYGSSDAAAGSVACTTGSAPGSRVEQWAPLTAGSHFYETGFSTVWNRIGAQLPFPDTSDDSTSQDNGAGLSWTSMIGAGSVAAFSHLTAFSPTGTTTASDRDGDGFPDTWEEPTGGVDTNGDGTPDLKLSDYGATPDKPDVFVQVNWTQTRSCMILQWNCSTKNRRPSLAALNDVQKAFKAHGVRLHVDAGSDSVMNPDNGARWGSRSQVEAGLDTPALFTAWRDDLLSSERSRIFHSALYVGKFNEDGNTGLSRGSAVGNAARDFILAYDTFQGGHPTRQQEAGTFMHELGHNLGLSHGGSSVDANVNYKPNYPSLMNYFWQLSGTYKNDSIGLLDYSEGTLSPIDENSLSETVGLEPDAAASNIKSMWACPDGRKRGPLPSVRDVDWNCDGRSTGVESANVTGIWMNGPFWDKKLSDTDLTVVSDHNDWASLIFDGGGALGAAGDPASVPATTPPGTEPTAEELMAVAPDLHAVTITSPGQLAMKTGTASPVVFGIHNDRDSAVTYDLSQTADGVTLTGVPDHVTLATGASSTFTGTLTAGPVSDAAFFEVDAQVSGDPSNTASAVTEVYIVATSVDGQPVVPPAGPPAGPPAAPATTWTRVAGADRYETAVAVSKSGFPVGAASAVVASGELFPDGLSASYLAGQIDGPVLLTRSSSLPAATLAELTRLHVSTVYVAGGAGAVSVAVGDQLAALRGPNGTAVTVVRLAGADRYATAAAIAARFPQDSLGTVGGKRVALLASGTGFADALSGSAAAAGAHVPLLLTRPDVLSPQVLPTLQALGVSRVMLLGGTGAISTAVANQLTGAGLALTRLGGADRVITATLIASWEIGTLGFAGDQVAIARGDEAGKGFDALSAGEFIGAGKHPLLLTASPNSLGNALLSWLGADKVLTRGIVVGGPAAISEDLMQGLSRMR